MYDVLIEMSHHLNRLGRIYNGVGGYRFKHWFDTRNCLLSYKTWLQKTYLAPLLNGGDMFLRNVVISQMYTALQPTWSYFWRCRFAEWWFSGQNRDRDDKELLYFLPYVCILSYFVIFPSLSLLLFIHLIPPLLLSLLHFLPFLSFSPTVRSWSISYPLPFPAFLHLSSLPVLFLLSHICSTQYVRKFDDGKTDLEMLLIF
jgi:hypothetical protein